MSDIFISYSRRDKDFVRALHTRLIEDGYDVWVDWEDIPATADWWAEITSAIEEAHLFGFVISPHSVLSEVCRKEINHAIENNKRFIPILYQELDDVNASHVHEAIRAHNWIDFSSGDLSDDAMRLLVKSFTTDPDYLRRHTRLLVRAREWQESGRQPSYLIEGAELNEFQAWLEESQVHEPKPTELQFDYILASQTRRTRVQLRFAAGLIFAILVIGIFAIVALLQQDRIQTQQQAFRATADAQNTQISIKETEFVEAQENQASLVDQVYSQNTQQAIAVQVTSLNATIAAFETRSAITNTPMPTASPTVTPTPTSTLPPTWTPTVVVMTTDEPNTEDGQASAQSVPTSDPVLIATGTAQANLYITATQEALVTPTVTATLTSTPTATVTQTPPPTVTPTLDVPAPIALDSQTVTYTVQEGDIGLQIADSFNVTVEEIADANEMANLSRIFIGQELLIPYRTNVSTDETLIVAQVGTDSPTCGSEIDPCRTINGALEAATGFAQIRLVSGVYDEQIIIDRDVVLVGSGIDSTIINAEFEGTVITINEGVKVTLVDVTIAGGSSTYGGGILNMGELNINNVRISGNVAQLAGGGLVNAGVLIADAVDFERNSAAFYDDVYTAPNAAFIVTDNMDYDPDTTFVQARANQPNDARFKIGEVVIVITTDGDRLRLRERPSVSANIVQPLERGTPLIIVGGSRDANGFRWWEVQVSIDRRGWVVEFDDEATIMPIDELVRRPSNN